MLKEPSKTFLSKLAGVSVNFYKVNKKTWKTEEVPSTLLQATINEIKQDLESLADCTNKKEYTIYYYIIWLYVVKQPWYCVKDFEGVFDAKTLYSVRNAVYSDKKPRIMSILNMAYQRTDETRNRKPLFLAFKYFAKMYPEYARANVKVQLKDLKHIFA